MIGAKVQGMAQLRQKLGKLLPNEAHGAARRALTRFAAKIRDDIRAHAPDATGTTKNAVRSRRGRGNRETAVAEVFITKGRGATHDAWYWHFSEFGTVNMPATPFITPAVERARSAMPGELGGELMNQIEKALAKKGPAARVEDAIGEAVAGSGPVGVGGDR